MSRANPCAPRFSSAYIEDVFAAVTLFIARPVWVGDFCRSGDVLGTVEEIGLRWSRFPEDLAGEAA